MSDSNKHNGANDEKQSSSITEGEYRIIPVDNTEDANERDAVNLGELVAAFGKRKKFIGIITAAFLVLGILYAILAPVEYKSEAMVLPEVGSSPSEFSSLLKNYGGLLGLGDNTSFDLSKNKSISPQVYPQIVHSLTFQHQMLEDTVYFADINKRLTLFQYFKDRSASFYEGWFGSSDSKQDLSTLPDSLRRQFRDHKMTSVSKKEMQVIKELRKRINIEFDSGTGVMQVTARIPDAVAAAQVCKQAITLLTNYLKEYRTKKAQNVLNFANEQYQIGQKRFISVQNKLAKFKDQNVNLSTAKSESRLDYLQAEFDLAYNIYNNVAQKRIQARMNLQENTPVFKILQSANVPLTRDSPLWIPIVLFSSAVGLVLSFLIVSGQYVYRNYQDESVSNFS